MPALLVLLDVPVEDAHRQALHPAQRLSGPGRRQHLLPRESTATAMYHEMDMQFWLEQAEAELWELS